MSEVYFILAETKCYYLSDFMESGVKIKLIKEQGNKVDMETICVDFIGLGKIGYVANSTAHDD
jgi:hypothetical protein